MDWTQSYSAIWRVYRVNRNTWADASMLTEVDSVNITRTSDGSLLESGSMTLTGDFEPDYYRIVMTAEQGGSTERVDVATLLFDTNGGGINYGTTQPSINGHSVLYPASTTAVVTGEYAPAGVDGAAYVGQLLSNAINAPVQVDGSFTLDEHVVFDLGESVLEAAWAVLDAGGFVIQIDGRGVVHVIPKPTEPSWILDNTQLGVLTSGIEYSNKESEISNRYIVISGVNITIAENNDPTSPVSTVNRGFCIDTVDTSPTLTNDETMAGYARRRLEEESVLEDVRSYSREFLPDVTLYSIIRASIGGMLGDYRVKSQTLECNNGIVVSEKCSKETKLWTAS